MPTHPRSKKSPTLSLETIEPRLLLSAAVESVTGANNNLANPAWGQAGTDLIRLAAAAYADGISAPSLSSNLSARAISNILNNQISLTTPTADQATVDRNSVSDFGYAFGQFIDHDMDLTPTGSTFFNIPVGANDPIGPNAQPLYFTRSITDPATGTSTANPAQQITTVTAYLDLSQIYGSSQAVADALRTFSNGLLKTSPGNMLPYDNTTYFTPAQISALNMANDAQAVSTDKLFAAGDVRANENIELTALETLFVRNHNRLAAEVQQQNPTWSDEQIYQEARKLNIADYQMQIYNEWIPAVLGQNALKPYAGYLSSVNASIANEFSTVAFRFGHTMVSGGIARENNDGSNITVAPGTSSTIQLANDFFDPNLLNPSGVTDPLTGQTSSDIGPILKGDADGDGQKVDTLAISDIRNLLFGNGGMGGDDLMARDVQRGRDNGIPDYNTLRAALGLPKITSFAQISADPAIQKELALAYPGGVNTIDAFEGGLAENHLPGSDVGPLFQTIMANQFSRLRDGDRFFYLNQQFTPAEQQMLSQSNTLSKTIAANTNITNLQPDAFLYRASISGFVQLPPPPPSSQPPRGTAPKPNATLPPPPPPSLANLTVQLLNADGTIVAITTTDQNGHYLFTDQSGPSTDDTVNPGLSTTGTYSLKLLLPATATQPASTLTSPALTITHGDTNLHFDFHLKPLSPPPPTAIATSTSLINNLLNAT